MGEFTRRVLSYPIISGPISLFGSAVEWLLGPDRYNRWFHFGQQAVTLVKDQTVAVTGTATLDRLDTIACRQILDRLESLVPQVAQSPEEMFTPLADRAISLAETFLAYFVDSSEPTNCATSPPLSHADRLARLHSTVMSMQAVKSALSTSSSVYQKMQESLTTLLSLARRPPVDEKSDSTATPGATSFGSAAVGLSQLLSQYQSASVIAFPKFQSFIDGAVFQAQELLTEIRQNGPTEFVVEQLNALTRGLHSTLLSLNTTRTAWFQDLFSKNSEEAEERSPAELSSASAQADPESLQAQSKAATAADISHSTPISAGSESDLNSANVSEVQPSSAALTTAEGDLKESQPVEPKLPTDAKKEKEEQLIEKPGSRKKVTPGAAESHEIPNQETVSDDTCKTSEDAGKGSATLDHADPESLRAQSKTAAAAEISDSTPTSAGSESDFNSANVSAVQSSSAALTTAEGDLKESQPVAPKTPTDAKKEEEEKKKKKKEEKERQKREEEEDEEEEEEKKKEKKKREEDEEEEEEEENEKKKREEEEEEKKKREEEEKKKEEENEKKKKEEEEEEKKKREEEEEEKKKRDVKDEEKKKEKKEKEKVKKKEKEEQLSEKPESRKEVALLAAESHEIPTQETLSDDTCKTSADPGKDSARAGANTDDSRGAEAEGRKAQSKTHKHRRRTPTGGAASAKGASPTRAEVQSKCEPQTTTSSEPTMLGSEVVGDDGVAGSQPHVQSHKGKKRTQAKSAHDSAVRKLETEFQQTHIKDATLEGVNKRQDDDHTKRSESLNSESKSERSESPAISSS